MVEVKKTPSNIVDDAYHSPWKIALEPFKVAPHIHYVGNAWVGCFLIDTAEGLVLIDTAISETLYLLLESIRKLGFDPMDIKKILLTHAHEDHDGGARQIKEMTGAEIWLAKEDLDFKNNPDVTQFSGDYAPDCFYDDNKPIVMGDIIIRTKLTAGHTPGTTSFFVDVKDEQGKTLVWGMHGGVGTNTLSDSYFKESKLPVSLRDRFISDCEKLKAIHVDICTPSHPAHSNMLQLVPQIREDFNPFIDPKRWPDFLDERAESARSVIGK
jgi:Zn-dependent hydrolases, including glyoxylases